MIVGITGHQDLSQYDIKWIQNSINLFLSARRTEKACSSLAIGADQLFVQILIELDKSFDVIIPCRQYSKTFKDASHLHTYYQLLKEAQKIYTLDFEEPSEKAFYEAGIKIVEMSDVMLAVWNGKKAKGLGGTGDIVKAAIRNQKKVFHINPVNKTTQML